MNNKTHKIGGICSGLIASTLLCSSNFGLEGGIASALIISGSVIGSLAPDIDHPQSKVGRKFILKPISIFINKVFGHRTITHSIVMLIFMTTVLLSSTLVFTGISNFIYSNLILGFCIGWFSHLFLDALTVDGIPVFYPFIKKKYNLLKIRLDKDGKKEEFISIILILITGILIVAYFRL